MKPKQKFENRIRKSTERKASLRKKLDRKRLYEDLSYSGMGIELVVATLIGALIGYFLDKYFKTGPWLLVVGILLGAAAGFLNIYELFIKSSN